MDALNPCEYLIQLRPPNGVIYLDCIWDLYDHTRVYEGLTTADFFLPLIRYFGETKAINSGISVILDGRNNKKGRTRGFDPVDKEWGNDLDFAREKNESIEVLINDETKQLFERYIRECKDLGIQLIFVYTPEYIEGQKYISNRQQILDYYYEISETYAVPFLDYSDHDICLDTTYFYNSLHMNKRGAELFSHDLARKLAELIAYTRK